MVIPEPFSVPFGQRLRALRNRAGKTRAVLGGLVGRSEEWVKALETGRLQMPRLPMLIRLAEVLGVADLEELTGDQSISMSRMKHAEHPAAPAIRDAVQRYHLSRPTEEPHPVPVAVPPNPSPHGRRHGMVRTHRPARRWRTRNAGQHWATERTVELPRSAPFRTLGAEYRSRDR